MLFLVNQIRTKILLPASACLLIPLYTPVMINSFHITSEKLVLSYAAHTKHLTEA